MVGVRGFETSGLHVPNVAALAKLRYTPRCRPRGYRAVAGSVSVDASSSAGTSGKPSA